MTEAVAAYTTDIVYPSAFGAFQSPIHLVHAAWLGGRRAPDVSSRFTYVDLGCGAGLTACVLADCYPEAQFHGVDVNEEHVRRGRELAERAGLSNVSFHCMDFLDLPQLKVPHVDFVGLSGVYSWLSADRKQAALAFAGERLTESGVVFLHYAALPGNAQIDALYTLIREAAQDVDGDSITKFRAACAAVMKLRGVGARFFRVNPQADAWMAQLVNEDTPAMIHEVLNAQRSSLSVRDASIDAAQAGLVYVANAQIELNHLELVAPDALNEDLARRDVITREMMMDAIRAPHSRMDVLMRRDAPRSTEPPQLWVDCLDRGPATASRQNLSQKTGLDLMAPIYSMLLQSLTGGARRLPDLLQEMERAGHAQAQRALQVMAALKLVHFQRAPYAAASRPTKPVLASALNRLVLEEEIEAAGAIPFASPVAGTQLLLGPADRLALLALTNGDFGSAWRRIQQQGKKIKVGGQPVESEAALRQAAAQRSAAIGDQIITRLAQLGVVAG